ncbi:hypothetical protein CJ030_MR2G000904 [Morella rubra]|uniref:Uncharacterized protein n=1 Tax=Morella rubra TaxID=262757 RepID=A0A6A1WG75_9ROSI|nr:hypothetical protein CJ030_MR2G000904 [Morella rubra]
MTKRFTIPEPPLGDIVKSWFLKDLGEKWRTTTSKSWENKIDRSKRRSTLRIKELRTLCSRIEANGGDWTERFRKFTNFDEFRVDGSIGWSPSDRYAQVIGPERHGRIRGVGLGPTPSSHPTNTNEQRQYQDVANNNHVSPAIHRSSHASRKTSVADNADDAESAGADGAEGGED